jgi:hypothetical protein
LLSLLPPAEVALPIFSARFLKGVCNGFFRRFRCIQGSLMANLNGDDGISRQDMEDYMGFRRSPPTHLYGMAGL